MLIYLSKNCMAGRIGLGGLIQTIKTAPSSSFPPVDSLVNPKGKDKPIYTHVYLAIDRRRPEQVSVCNYSI